MVDHGVHLHAIGIAGSRVIVTGKEIAHAFSAQQARFFDGFITEVPISKLLHLLPLLGFGVGWRGHERELLSLVEHLRQQAGHRFAQHIFFGFALDPQLGWHLHRYLRQVVVEEGWSGLHRVSHIHPVAPPGEDLAFEHCFNPHVLGPIEGVATLKLGGIELIGDRFPRRIVLQCFTMRLREELWHQRRTGQPRLQAARGEAHHRL